MRLKSILLLSMTMITLSVVAQSSYIVTGKVVDTTDQQPLIGALVETTISKSTATNEKGFFSLQLPEGEHQIEISYLGYETKTMAIDSNNSQLGVIALEVSATSLKEILISATSGNFNDDFKGSNFRISPVAIKNFNPLNTEEVLRTIPGVNIVGDMGLSNRPNISIRGSWGRRSKKVLLMEDGSPAAPAPYIAPGAYYNPVSYRIQAIEVYKGADMLRFGPNNMFGAVNYITALPPQKPELRLKLVGGQRGYTTGLISYGGTWNNLGSLVEAVYKKFDGFTDNSSVEVLNLNAKIFAKLSEDQSLYFKVSGQFENNQASLSAMTPFTFETDPTQHPFDADLFTMRRYGLDIIHKWLPKTNISLVSKIYASDFERDWWRQVTTVIKASEVRNYLGDDIFNDRYRYLNGLNFNEDDYVRVGKITNGRESITDSRWIFTVSGLQETMNIDWNAWGEDHHLEAGVKLHQETYKDRFLRADSSRWARSGRATTDLRYYLWSLSGYIRNEFNVEKFSFTPIIRFEHINMYRQDILALSQDPTISSLEDGRKNNVYDVALPGITASYSIPHGEIFGSVYRGFIAPSKVFGFFVERNGVLTNPFAGEKINVQPEVSLNTEIGWRGSLAQNLIEGQLTYFNNTIHNFIAGGENEIFQGPGKINIQGFETGVDIRLIPNSPLHNLKLTLNVAFLHSKVLEGALLDKDMFGQVVHSAATRQEFLDHVATHPQAYDIYMPDAQGNEVIVNEENVNMSNFDQISKAIVRFGEGNIEKAEAPYTPHLNLSSGLSYDYNKWSAGITGNYVSKQYTEFMNFEHESADGAIGKLPSYFTMDAYLSVYQLLPYQRLALLMKDVFGLPISEGSISNLLSRAASKATPFYEAIQGQIQQAGYVGSDETGTKVNGTCWWVWCWQNVKNTFLKASDNRGSQTVEDTFPLGLSKATLGSDRWAAQLKTVSKSKQLCLAHLQRDLIYLEESEENFWATHCKTLLQEAIKLGKLAQERGKAWTKEETPACQLENRLNDLLLASIDTEHYKQTATFQRSLLKHRDCLLVFLYDLEVPPDNNGAERAIRNVKVNRIAEATKGLRAV